MAHLANRLELELGTAGVGARVENLLRAGSVWDVVSASRCGAGGAVVRGLTLTHSHSHSHTSHTLTLTLTLSHSHSQSHSHTLGRWRLVWSSRESLVPTGIQHHPGGNPGANLKSISYRCHPILVAFVWELTKETIFCR